MLIEELSKSNPWLLNCARNIDVAMTEAALRELERRQSGVFALPDSEVLSEAEAMLARFVAWHKLRDNLGAERLETLAACLEQVEKADAGFAFPRVSLSLTLGDGSAVTLTAKDIRGRLGKEGGTKND